MSDADAKAVEDIDKEAIQDSSEMILIIESYGGMAAKDILTKAADALSNNLDEFAKAIK